MCRAMYAVVVGADEAAAALLRRACGLEVQVMDVLVGAGALPAGPFDVVIIDARAEGARAAAASYRQTAPEAALLWVGADAPADVHGSVAADDVTEQLPGAIVRALLARRR